MFLLRRMLLIILPYHNGVYQHSANLITCESTNPEINQYYLMTYTIVLIREVYTTITIMSIAV